MNITSYSPALINRTVEKYNKYARQNGYNVIKDVSAFQSNEFSCKIVDFMPSSLGKFSESGSPYSIIMELKHFFPLLAA